jgi:hypothetical protein
MRTLLLFLAVITAACGHKIGDACLTGTDCSNQDNVARVCDTTSPQGYCTVEGCDFQTCPGEAVCARFFPGVESTAPACTTGTECGIDEFCTVGGRCAPRAIERRFCMLTCGSDGDCRDGYECRTLELMRVHGGEPVPDPQTPGEVPATSFCAPLRTCTLSTECEVGETCDPLLSVCRAQ